MADNPLTAITGLWHVLTTTDDPVKAQLAGLGLVCLGTGFAVAAWIGLKMVMFRFPWYICIGVPAAVLMLAFAAIS
jgi:hypothetical protein